MSMWVQTVLRYLQDLPVSLKMLMALILSIVVWELVKGSLLRLLSVRLYRREDRGTVVHVDLRRWDRDGMREFRLRGYTTIYPEREE